MSKKRPHLRDVRPHVKWRVPALLCMLVLGLWSRSLLLASRAALSDSESVGISITITTASNFPVNVIAAPEKRVPTTNNDDTRLEVEVRNVGSSTALFRQTIRTSSGGYYSGLTLSGISPGTYDITAKGYSHLRRNMPSVALSEGTTIDFSTGGTVKLLSGDVNSSSGDNLVNGIDLTQIVNDLTSNTERYDLNRDTVINGIDLTNAITNLTQTGDS